MRVLVVSPTPSHPQNAGNRRRIAVMMERLKAFGHEVHFCFIRREWVEDSDIEAMREAWDGLTLIPYDRNAETKSKGDVFGIDDWCSDAVMRDVGAATKPIQPDVVFVEYVFYSRILNLFGPDVVKVLDTHDVFGDRHLHLKKVGLQPSFFYTSVAEEKVGLDRADVVIAIQDEEAAYLQKLTKASVVTLGYMEQMPTRYVPDAKRATIGYIGSGNPLNIRGVRRFLETVAPHAHALVTDKVRIGGGASSAAEQMPDIAEPVGHLPDVGDFYDMVDLCVNPHEGGTGLKIKTVEGLGYGRPVIGTAEAFAGLAPRETFHSASNAIDVGELAVRYASDGAFREKVRAASADLTERYAFSVNQQYEIFRDVERLRAAAERPRILLITDIPFWQEALGNHARIAEQIRILRQTIDVDVFVFRSLSPRDMADAQAIVGGRGRVFSFKKYEGSTTKQPIWLESSGVTTPFEKKAMGRQYFASLEEHLAEHRYHGALIHYIRLSYLRHARGMPEFKILDVHDIMSQREMNFAHFGLDHFIKIDQREELTILSSFTLVLAIQAREYEFLGRLFPGKAMYFPHVLPTGRVRSRMGPARKIIFVGGDSPMNRDGLRWFLNQVWPCFAGGEAELHVAGEVCKSFEGESHPNVVLHGRIGSLPSFLHGADLAINPVYYGGGLKIKTVEYLCYGIPAVLTLEAVDGVPGGAGEAYFLAESRDEFIEGLHRLIHDAQYRQSMSEAAFAFGRRVFGQEAVASAVQSMAAALRAETPPVQTELAKG